MAKTWSDVAASSAFQALSLDDQEEARRQYFDDVVAPQVPKQDLELARGQFFDDAKVAPKRAATRQDTVSNPTYSDPMGADFGAAIMDVAQPASTNSQGLIQRVGEFLKPSPKSVMEGYTPTPKDRQAEVDQRLSYGAGPISQQTAAAADMMRSNPGTITSRDKTVNKVVKAMDARGDKSFGDLIDAAKNPSNIKAARDTTADEFRTAGEWTADTLSSLGQGFTSLVQLPVNIIAPDSTLANDLRKTQKELQAQESDVLQAQRDKMRDRIQNEDGFLDKYYATVVSLVTNPALALSEAAKQVPMFIGVIGAARMSAAGAAGAVGLAGRASPTLALGEAISGGAIQTAARAAGATAGGAGASMVMAGGDAAGGVYEKLTDPKQTPMSVWEQNPDFQKLTSEGKTSKEAITEIAIAKSRMAALVTAPLGLLGFMGAESAIASRGLGKATSEALTIGGAGKLFAKDLIGEQLEEGGTQFGGNLVSRTVDPRQSLSEGVPEAMATAAVTSVPFSAVGARSQYLDAQQQQPTDIGADRMARGLLDVQNYDPSLISPAATTRTSADIGPSAPITNFTPADSPTAQAGLAPIVVPNALETSNVSSTDALGNLAAGRSDVSGGLVGRSMDSAGLTPLVTPGSGVGADAQQSGLGDAATVSAGTGTLERPAGVNGLERLPNLASRATDSDLMSRVNTALSQSENNNADTRQPIEQWVGRKGDGYVTLEDAQQALPGRQSRFPNLDWTVEQMPSGKYRLAGYESTQENVNGPQAPQAQQAAPQGQEAPAAAVDEPITAPSGKPFSTAKTAEVFAQQNGIVRYSAVQVPGGWALQSTESANGIGLQGQGQGVAGQATAPAGVAEQAAPGVRNSDQRAVGFDQPGQSAGAPAVGGVATDATGAPLKLALPAPAPVQQRAFTALKASNRGDVVASTAPLREDQQAASALSRMMGKTATFFSLQTPGKVAPPNAFVTNGDTKNIFIDSNADDAPTALVFHEGWHGLPPEKKKVISEQILPLFKQEMRAEFGREFGYDESQLDEEIPAFIAQSVSRKPEFMGQLKEKLKNKEFASAIGLMIDNMKNILARASNQFGKGFSDKYITDVQKAVDILSTAYAEHMDSQSESVQTEGTGAITASERSRIDMNFKDVIKRTPELQEGMAKLQAGEITKADYDKLVNEYKPVEPYASVPDPVTPDAARFALANGRGQSEEKAAKFGLPSQEMKAGDPTQLRLDIPSYSEHGAWVVSVHRPEGRSFGAGKVVGYEPVASVQNVEFGMLEKSAAKIAAGANKGTIATIMGDWKPTTPKQAKLMADQALKSKDWAQVGMDPERHSYFYDRKTMQPIVSADEVIQIGPLVLAKNPVYGNKADFMFSNKAAATKDTVIADKLQFSSKSNERDLVDVPTMTLQDLKDKKVIGIKADLMDAGRSYTGIDGSQLMFPVEMMGGPNYPRLTDSQKQQTVWAVRGGAVLSKILDKVKQADYILVVAMNNNSHLTNSTATEAYIKTVQAYLRDGKIQRDNLLALDEIVRSPKNKNSLPDFPGFESPNIIEYIDKLSFYQRGALAEILEKKEAQSHGLPSIDKFRRATLDQDYAGYRQGDAMLVLEIDKQNPTIKLGENGTKLHPAYPLALRGRVVGKLAKGVNYETIFRDYFQYAVPNFKNKEEGAWYSFDRIIPVQTITPEIANSISDGGYSAIKSARQAEAALALANSNWLVSGKTKENGGVSIQEFVDALASNDGAAALTMYTPKEVKAGVKEKTFSVYQLGNQGGNKGLQVFFGLKRGRPWYADMIDGVSDSEVEVVSVTNNEPGAPGIGIPAIITKAISEGATILDAFAVKSKRFPDGFLPEMYGQFGFEKIGSIPFDPSYYDANQLADLKKFWSDGGWKEADGYPDVVVMQWKGKDEDRATAIERYVRTGETGISEEAARFFGSPTKENVGQRNPSSDEQGGDRGSNRRQAGGDQGAGDAASVVQRAYGSIQEIASLSDGDIRNLGLDPKEVSRLRDFLAQPSAIAASPTTAVQFSNKATPADKIRWRKITDVKADIGNLDTLPKHIVPFATFMKDMATKATNGGLTSRDVIKAYTIARSSMNRSAVSTDKVKAAGLALPDSFQDAKIRPEGAFGYWLLSPTGQQYLNAAEVAIVDADSIANAVKVMAPFGTQNTLGGDLERAANGSLHTRLPGMTAAIAKAAAGKNAVKDWQDATDNMYGVREAKKGFLGSLLGFGQLPTFDARQINVNVQSGSKEDTLKALSSKQARNVVAKLSRRMDALGLAMDPEFSPFYQHLVHHAVWDAVGGTETTHSDVIDSMIQASNKSRPKLTNLRPEDVLQPDTIAAAHAAVAKYKRPDGPDPLTKEQRLQGEIKLKPMFDAARSNKPEFDRTLERIAEEVGGFAKTPGIKKPMRAVTKLVTEMKGDASKMKDLLRGTIVVSDVAAAQDAIERIGQVYRFDRIKNRMGADLTSPDGTTVLPEELPTGYQDILTNVILDDGTVAEIQITTPEMAAAKNLGHEVYAFEREMPKGPVKDRMIALQNQVYAEGRSVFDARVSQYANSSSNTARETSPALLRTSEGLRGEGSGTQAVADDMSAGVVMGTSSQSKNRVPGGRDLKSNGISTSNDSITNLIDSGIQASNRQQSIQGQQFYLKGESRTDATRIALQDYFLRVKQVQDAIASQGGTVGEAQDVYLAEELSYGRLQEQLVDFKDKVIKPLIQQVKAADLELSDLALYAYARHAKERNAAMRSINSRLKRGEGSGMTDDESDDIINAFRKDGKEADLQKLHGKLMDIVTTTRLVLLDEGLITRDEYDAWSNKYNDYVPLRGFAEDEQDIVTGARVSSPRMGGKGFNIRGKESVRALGRTSRAGHIIENIVSDYERAIARAERNNVAKVFLDLATTNPDPSLWEIDAQRTSLSLNRQTGAVQANTMIDKGEDTISVKLDGKEVYVKIHDPLLVRALRQASKDETGQATRILAKGLGWYTTLMRNTLTRFNPAFGFTNAVKDLGFGAVSALGDMGPKGAALFMKHYANPVQSGPMFDEFRAAGATTGGWHMRDAKELQKELQRLMDWEGGSGVKATAHKLGMVVLDALEFIGSASETQARFAAYKAARELGKSPAQAGSIAKNLTTNFNRKGEWGAAMNTLYLFFNAGVQGSAKMASNLKSPAVMGAMAGLAGLSAGLALYGASAGGDDDDGQAYWDKIPDFEKERNLIIMLPPGKGMMVKGESRVGTNGRYIKIPIQYGLNVFSSLGYQTAGLLRNAQDKTRGVKPSKAAINMVSATFGAFNPFGGSVDVTNPVELGMAVSPSIVDLGIQFGVGVNAFGKPVAPTKSSFDTKPDSENFSPNMAGTWEMRLARWLNSKTGGDAAVSGKIDVSPGTVRNVVRNLTGGTGDFLSSVFVNIPSKLWSPDGELGPRDVPVLKAFYGQVDDTVNMGLYYERRAEVLKAAEDAARQQKLGIRVDYDPEQRGMQSLGRAAQQFGQMMGKLRKAELAVAEDAESDKPRYTEAERNQKRKDLQEERANLARQFNAAYYQMEKDVAAGKYEPKRSISSIKVNPVQDGAAAASQQAAEKRQRLTETAD